MPDIRLGHLTFLNAHPVYAGLRRLAMANEAHRFELVRGQGAPVALNRLLERGEIDATPASSVAVAGFPERFLPAPAISISSEGAVGSVILFSRLPLRELHGRPVILPGNSATSVALLQVLCRYHWSISPRFILHRGEPLLRNMMALGEAALLIGDEALKARLEWEGLEQIDLGEVWHAFSGLPMVFALWAFRAEWVQTHPQAFEWACARLDEARRVGMDTLEEDIPALASAHGLSADSLRRYYSCLDCRYEVAHRRGLALFMELAARMEEERRLEAVGDER